MQITGATRKQIERAARAARVGIRNDYRREPRPELVRLTTLGPRPKYRRLSSRSRCGRSNVPRTIPGAVCWHGHRAFMRALFKLAPKATIRTTLATYRGREDFERSHWETQHFGGRYMGYGIEPAATAYCLDYAGPIRAEDLGEVAS